MHTCCMILLIWNKNLVTQLLVVDISRVWDSLLGCWEFLYSILLYYYMCVCIWLHTCTHMFKCSSSCMHKNQADKGIQYWKENLYSKPSLQALVLLPWAKRSFPHVIILLCINIRVKEITFNDHSSKSQLIKYLSVEKDFEKDFSVFKIFWIIIFSITYNLIEI